MLVQPVRYILSTSDKKQTSRTGLSVDVDLKAVLMLIDVLDLHAQDFSYPAAAFIKQ